MTAAQMLKAAGFPDTPQGRKSFYSQYPDEQAFMKKHGKKMAMGGLTNEVGFPQQPTANKFYSEGFRPSVPFGFYQDGGNQQDAQMQQLMAKIAQQLQQGAQPQQILQELVKMGVPQDQAAKILQTTIQYLQQHPSPQQAQGQPQEAPEQEAQEPMQQQGPEEEQMEGPQMAYGGYTDKFKPGGKTGGPRQPRVYTNPLEYAKAKQAYQDSLNLYNQGELFNEKWINSGKNIITTWKNDHANSNLSKPMTERDLHYFNLSKDNNKFSMEHGDPAPTDDSQEIQAWNSVKTKINPTGKYAYSDAYSFTKPVQPVEFTEKSNNPADVKNTPSNILTPMYMDMRGNYSPQPPTLYPYTEKQLLKMGYQKSRKDGGTLDEIAFPQQPTANHFYNSGWKPNTPFGFYEEGGLTDEIAFPQQPVDAWIHAHTPYVPSYNVGGGLPDGANDMPCMNCGGYMQDGGSSDGSANQYGGNVGMGNTYLKQGGVKKLSRKQKGGSAAGNTIDDYAKNMANTFMTNLQNNTLTNLQKEAEQAAQQNAASATQDFFGTPSYATEQEDQQSAYAQYGTEMGSDNTQNPYNDYNPATAQNQLALINQAQGYDDQRNNAWKNFGNAAMDMYSSTIPQAQVGLSTGQTGPYSPQYKDYIDKATKAAQAAYGQKNKTTFYDPRTGEWKSLDVPQGQQQDYGNYHSPSNQARYDSQGLRYFPTNYSPYIKWNARGNSGSSANWSELLSKYNPSDTRLLNKTTNYRKGLGKLLWGPEVKSETYNFRSHLDPEEFQGTNVSDQTQPAQAAPIPSAHPTPYNIPAGIAKPTGTAGMPVYNTLVPPYLQTKKLGGLPKAQMYNSQVGAPYANENENESNPYVNESESPAEAWKKNPIGMQPKYGTYSTAPANTSNTISGYGYADAWGGNQPAPTAVGTFGAPQGQLTGDQFKTNPEPLSGKSPDSKYFDWNLKGKKKLGINGEPLAQGIMAGTNLATSFANAPDRQNALNQMNANTQSLNQFASKQRPINGKYNWTGMSTGMLSPNQYVQVQQPGVTPSYMSAYGGQYAFGGESDDQNDIYDLSEEEIQNILANGGQIEYLD